MIASFIMGVLFVLLCFEVLYLQLKCRAHVADNKMLRETNADLLTRSNTFRDQLAQAIQREQQYLAQHIQINLSEETADRIAAQVAPFLVARTGRVQ
jgi:hypothetical protein